MVERNVPVDGVTKEGAGSAVVKAGCVISDVGSPIVLLSGGNTGAPDGDCGIFESVTAGWPGMVGIGNSTLVVL